jgi:hypothetical protein
MPLFVSFQDSSIDPTYSLADDVLLVESDATDDDDDNPCVGRSVRRTAPVAPMTATEIQAFASIMGWAVETDNDGNLVLYPGVSAEDDEDTGEDA